MDLQKRFPATCSAICWIASSLWLPAKSNRHINSAYVAADHLCGMRQMASACLIADADYLGTSRGTRGDVPCSNQNLELLLRACGFHEGAGPLGSARDVQDRMYLSSQHFGSAALSEPRTSRTGAGWRELKKAAFSPGKFCAKRETGEKNRGEQQRFDASAKPFPSLAAAGLA